MAKAGSRLQEYHYQHDLKSGVRAPSSRNTRRNYNANCTEPCHESGLLVNPKLCLYRLHKVVIFQLVVTYMFACAGSETVEGRACEQTGCGHCI
jgi:hypothetical protein